jgi:tRNA U55 pseudouridine synthase TruB
VEQIKGKLDSIIPERELPLTPFSAKKKDGKKLYELARN